MNNKKLKSTMKRKISTCLLGIFTLIVNMSCIQKSENQQSKKMESVKMEEHVKEFNSKDFCLNYIFSFLSLRCIEWA